MNWPHNWKPYVTNDEELREYKDNLMRKTDEANILVLETMWDFYRTRTITKLDLTEEISQVIDTIESRTATPAPAPRREEPPPVIEEPEEPDDEQADNDLQNIVHAFDDRRIFKDPLTEKISRDLRGIGRVNIHDKIAKDLETTEEPRGLAAAIEKDLRSFT